MKYKLLTIFLLLSLMLPAIPPARAFYDTSWSRAIRISVDSSDIDRDLTDFPVLVYLTSSRINWTETQDDLDDIRFVDQENTTYLDYEIENYTVNDEAWLWVNLPFVNSTSNTVFYLYWGNTGASSGESPTDVWDSDYELVYHLNDLTTSTVEDSTSNNRDGTKHGANEPILYDEDDSRIDGSQDWDGTDDDLSLPAFALGGDTVTLEYWLNNSQHGVNVQSFLGDGAQAGGSGYLWINRPTGADNLNFEYADGVNPSAVNLGNVFTGLDDTWVHLVIVANYTSENVEAYRNGVSFNNSTMTTSLFPSTSRTRYLGAYNGLSHYYVNLMDEFRLSTTDRPQEYVLASYESGRDRLLSYSNNVEYYPPLTNPCALIHPDNPDNQIEQLFFGDGRAMGLLLIFLVAGVVAHKSPGLGGICLIPIFLLAYQYLARAQCDPTLNWYFVGSIGAMLTTGLMVFSKRG